MTQTSPKPSDQNASNGYKYSAFTASDRATVPNSTTDLSEPERTQKIGQTNQGAIFQPVTRFWNNLGFRSKLTLLLVSGAVLPVVIITEISNTTLYNYSDNALKQSLHRDLLIQQDLFNQVQERTQDQAANVADQIQKQAIDLNNPKTISQQGANLTTLLANYGEDTSFAILTNAQGKTVAQKIQILDRNFSQPQLLPTDKNSAQPGYRQISVPVGLNLQDVPIVKNSLETGRSLEGAELLQADVLTRLGLANQAYVGERSQLTKGLSANSQPATTGVDDSERGKLGLVAMSVQPIKVNNKMVGTAIVGTLINHNYTIVDRLKQDFGIPVATFFAKDYRVSSNVPYLNPVTKKTDNTRAIGIHAAREVTVPVLNEGKEYIGHSNIGGVEYIGAYKPLYDHRKQLNSDAKPIGMFGLAQTYTEAQAQLNSQRGINYATGGILLAFLGLVGIPLAGTFSRPVRRLSRFAQRLATGESGVRMEATDRQDEIGILSQELNQMAASIDASLEERRQQAQQAQLFADLSTFQGFKEQELATVFNQAVTGARINLNADRVVIYRFNPDWSGYITAESVVTGWTKALNNKIEDACIPADLIRAYVPGRVVPTNDVFNAGFHPEHLRLMERLQIKANLVTPIVRNGQLYGLLIAHHCHSPHNWATLEISFLKQVAERLGVILDRVTFQEQKEAENKRSQVLKDITVNIGQSLNATDIFNKAVQEIRQAMQSDRVVIYNFNELWQGTVTAESVGEGFPKAMGARIDDPCFANKYVERYRTGRVQATNNIHKAGLTECYLKQLEAFAVQANLVAPIIQGEQLLGLLIAHQCSAPRNWEQADIDLFSQLATQVGFALDRANLLEQQKTGKEYLQKRALELLIEVDPVSRGDLTIRANVTEDEIGTVADSYNSTIGSLRKIVSQVQQAAIQVAATTTSNESSVQGLSTEALRQTQEIAAALEQVQQMSNSIRAVAANASQAEAAVKQANATVLAGDAAMNRTVDGILAIRETVTETSKKVKLLGESSQKISQVVNLINRFAAQTNLLALKASIEAARAGEEGRGFAVIADEVRALARQSAEATGDIEALVKDIQTETSEVVAAMEAGTEQVATGTRLVDETRQSLNKITAVSNEIGSLVAAIAQAAAIQSQASESVTHKMSGVAAIAGKTSTEVTSVSASFKELQAVAQELQASVGQFKVN